MGAAQELKEKGSHRSVVAGVGEWGSVAFCGYVATTLDVERYMSKKLIEKDELPDVN